MKHTIEYTKFGNPEHSTIEWESDYCNIVKIAQEFAQNEIDWGRILKCPIPRAAIRIFKIDGLTVDDDELIRLASEIE